MGMEGGASVSVGGGVAPSEEVETQGGENNRTENRGRFFFPIRDLLMLTRRPHLPGPSLEVVFF